MKDANRPRGKISHFAFANYASRIWATVLSLACVPLYVGILGVEAYGLVGLFTLLQSALLLLDFGVTPTMNREMARTRAGTHSAQTIRNLIFSVELVALVGMAVMLAAGIILAGPAAEQWLKPTRIPVSEIESAIALMTAVVALRWIEQIYRACLTGAEDQIWLSITSILADSFRWIGALFYLKLHDPSVQGFFTWQLGLTLAIVILFRLRLVSILPGTKVSACFDPSELRKVRRYAAGMFVSSLLAFALTQFDKVLVSKLAPLEEFSAYMIAATVATGLLQLVNPLNAAVYPRMAEFVAAKRADALTPLFVDASQWLAALIVPAASVLAVFSGKVLNIWTGNTQVADQGAGILTFLALATMTTGLMNIPYQVQLAYGWTSLSIRVNGVALLLMAPVTYVLVCWTGAEGAAIATLLLAVVTSIFTAAIMFRSVLTGSAGTWFLRSVLVPVSGAGLSASLLSALFRVPDSRLEGAVAILLLWVMVQAATIAILPAPRRQLFALVRRLVARSPGSR